MSSIFWRYFHIAAPTLIFTSLRSWLFAIPTPSVNSTLVKCLTWWKQMCFGHVIIPVTSWPRFVIAYHNRLLPFCVTWQKIESRISIRQSGAICYARVVHVLHNSLYWGNLFVHLGYCVCWPRYGDSNFRYKTVVRPYFLHKVPLYTGEPASRLHEIS